jgi:spore maturation protein CgeB
VFSVDRATVPVHAEHAKAGFLPLAYDDRVFKPDGPVFESDILVLGSPFSARHTWLATLYEALGERITWAGPGWRRHYAAGRHIDRLVSPEECAALYRGAKIVINIHRDSSWSHDNVPWTAGDGANKAGIPATHLNPRFWEAAGCGSLQLCSEREDIHRFAPGCPVFRSPDALLAKAAYFLGNRRARETVSRQVYRKIRRQTYLERARTVLQTVFP